ncbi:MAG: hypothetical protein IKI04_03265, partial [Bacilli bacterium]|nr:hypothetical protein [Bacilli bacterium]
ILCISIIIVVLLLVILLPKNNSQDNIIIDEVSKIDQRVNNKDTFIIFYYDSDSNNSINDDIKNYLDNNDLEYDIYNKKSTSKIDHKTIVKLLNINEDMMLYPILIYIKEGNMEANVINIDTLDVVDNFINNYEI